MEYQTHENREYFAIRKEPFQIYLENVVCHSLIFLSSFHISTDPGSTEFYSASLEKASIKEVFAVYESCQFLLTKEVVWRSTSPQAESLATSSTATHYGTARGTLCLLWSAHAARIVDRRVCALFQQSGTRRRIDRPVGPSHSFRAGQTAQERYAELFDAATREIGPLSRRHAGVALRGYLRVYKEGGTGVCNSGYDRLGRCPFGQAGYNVRRLARQGIFQRLHRRQDGRFAGTGTQQAG